MSLYHDSTTIMGYLDEDFDSTITTSEAYHRQLEVLDESESFTIHYSNTLKKQISQSLLLKFELSALQFESIISILVAIIQIEDKCDCELKDIKISSSEDEEIVFHRKSQNGISILSIDSDGDILYNFTGFKTGFVTERYIYGENTDFEKLIYSFLSR